MNDTTLLLTESGLHRESARSRYGRPATGSPLQIRELLANGRPCSPIGTFLVFGARRRLMFHFKSCGASAMKSLQHFRSGRIPASGEYPSASTTAVSGCSLTSNSVTTPKLPPPPRNAQNKSGFSVALARTTEASTVTNVNCSTLSQDSPNRRVSHPVPPPRIKPEAPVWETTP